MKFEQIPEDDKLVQWLEQQNGNTEQSRKEMKNMPISETAILGKEEIVPTGNGGEKFNPQTEELLKFSVPDMFKLGADEKREAFFRFTELTREPKVLQDEEIKAILIHFLEQIKEMGHNKFIFKDELLDYLSESKVEDAKKKEKTLDRAYRIIFDLIERFPDEVSELYSGAHRLFEFVKPEVFFDSYLKIVTSEKLGKNKNPILGEMFSSLEYNMSYCYTEKYINTLSDKIDFKNTKSCFESSQLMNLAASLADYANSGSYSKKYNIGEKITKMFEEKGSDPKAIYLLGAKAEFLSKRLKNGYHPFVHQRGIFELTPGILACNKGEELLIIEQLDKDITRLYKNYESISNEIDTPPKELVEQAKARGEKTIEWTPDRDLIMLKNVYTDEIIKKMHSINKGDVVSLNNTEISKKQLLEYRNIIGTDFRDFLEEEFKIEFKKLQIPEQFFFLEYIQTQTNEEVVKLKEFINKSDNEKEKINKFRVFLSIEQGGKEMGDKILALGEGLPEDVAKKVFEKYGEIINKADNTEEEIRKIFGAENIPSRVLSSVKETLLKRGAKMLSDLGDKVMEEKFEVNEQEILKELDEIKEETIILGESIARLYREGIKVPIEEVTEIKEIPTEDLTKEQKKQLIKVYENGRPEDTYKNKEHLKLLVDEFTEELNDKNISVFEISFQGDNIIIAVVDKKDKDTLYVGGLTFVNDVRNPAVAEASMKHVLERFKDYNIKALVDSTNPILAMYRKRFGFEVIKELNSSEEMQKNAGVLYYEIEKKKEKRIEKENELEFAA